MTLNRGFLFAALVVVAAVGNASAATYIVGDTLGWTVPPTPAAYSTWASRHVFRVGDVLVFNYTTGFHDVAHVTKAAYDGCSSNNPIALATVGPSNFTLGSAGQDYYICTFGTHCVIGQKLAINVTAATPAPTMPPSTTPTPTMPPTTTPVTPTPTMPPTTTPTPTMPPSTTPTPTMTPMSPPSSSPSLSPAGTPALTPGSPMPSGGTPPPAPSSESTPGGSSPPPAPSSATVASVYAPLAVFASVLFALVI